MLSSPHKTIFAALAAGLIASTAQADTLVGVTVTNQLITFDSAMPTQGSTPMAITGLGANERILGIDWRPATGMLYALGSQANLYTLDIGSGAASLVAGLQADPTDMSAPFSGLRGQAFGVDFNPVPDLGQTAASLRVVSNTGQNLRINVNGANAGKVFTDTDLAITAGGTASIVASAYTNNDKDPTTGTMLFGIDEGSDMLYQQTVPNDGTLVAIAPLGVNTIGVTAFDVSASGMAYAALTDGLTGASMLYRIRLDGTGPAASALGALGVGGNTVMAPLVGLTAVSPVPEAGTLSMLAGGLAALGLVGMRARRRR